MHGRKTSFLCHFETCRWQCQSQLRNLSWWHLWQEYWPQHSQRSLLWKELNPKKHQCPKPEEYFQTKNCDCIVLYCSQGYTKRHSVYLQLIVLWPDFSAPTSAASHWVNAKDGAAEWSLGHHSKIHVICCLESWRQAWRNAYFVPNMTSETEHSNSSTLDVCAIQAGESWNHSMQRDHFYRDTWAPNDTLSSSSFSICGHAFTMV